MDLRTRSTTEQAPHQPKPLVNVYLVTYNMYRWAIALVDKGRKSCAVFGPHFSGPEALHRPVQIVKDSPNQPASCIYHEICHIDEDKREALSSAILKYEVITVIVTPKFAIIDLWVGLHRRKHLSDNEYEAGKETMSGCGLEGYESRHQLSLQLETTRKKTKRTMNYAELVAERYGRGLEALCYKNNSI